MKKYFLSFLIIIIISMSSICAERVCFMLNAYSLEKITFEEIDDSYIVKSNIKYFSYEFYDSYGNISTAEDASFFSVVSI